MRRVERPTVRDEPRKLIVIRFDVKVLSWLRETAEKKGNRTNRSELVNTQGLTLSVINISPTLSERGDWPEPRWICAIPCRSR